MRRAPSPDYGAAGGTRRERARYLADKARGRTPLNAPVYAYAPVPPPKQSFWSAGKGVLLGAGFTAGSLALALTLVALVRTDQDDAITDPDSGIEIVGDPTTTLPSDNFDTGKVPLEAPTTTTTAPPTTEVPTTAPVTEPPVTTTTAPPTTAAPTTVPPTTTRQPAPTITEFRAARSFRGCRDGDEVRVTFTWRTTNATSAELGRQGGDTDDVGTNDSVEQCEQPQATWVLTVTGPGGTTSRTAQVPF